MALKITQREMDGVAVLALEGRIVLGEESNALREKVKSLPNPTKEDIDVTVADAVWGFRVPAFAAASFSFRDFTVLTSLACFSFASCICFSCSGVKPWPLAVSSACFFMSKSRELSPFATGNLLTWKMSLSALASSAFL